MSERASTKGRDDELASASYPHEPMIVEAVARAIAREMHRGGDFGLDGDSAFDARPSEFLALAKAAVAVYSAWRLIATAPKDGSEILLYGHGVLRSGGVYAKGRHVGWSQRARDGSLYWATRDPAVDCEPTHWMPLPEHPESSGRNRADATPNPLSEGRERS